MLTYIKNFYLRYSHNKSTIPPALKTTLKQAIEKSIISSDKYPFVHATTRVEKCNNNIKDTTTYDGRVYYWRMLRCAYDCTKQFFDRKEIEVIDAQKFTRGFNQWTNRDYDGFMENHPYIRINHSNYSDPIIVDVLLRNIFMLHRGQSAKWYSLYGNAIYTKLPMVFIGTENELKDVWNEFQLIRDQDKLHNTKDDLMAIDDPMYFFNYKIQKKHVIENYENDHLDVQ